MHALDWIIVSGYLVFAIIVGLLSDEKASDNLEEYFLAGRTLKGWQAGLSMAASQFSADTPLLVTGLIATAGIFSLWRLWVYALAFLTLGFVLAASWRKVGVITDAELTEVRYGKEPALVLRIFKAIYLGTIFNCTVLAMVLLATTRIAEPFLLWNEWLPPQLFGMVVSLVQAVGVPFTLTNAGPDTIWTISANNLISILSICLVTTFYSTTGGLRNVVKTDIFQFVLMMAGTALFTFFAIDAIGGLGVLPAQLRALFADGGPAGMTADQILAFTPSEAAHAGYAVLLVMAVQWIAQMNSDGSGYLAQRAMACRSDKDAKQAAVVFTVVQIIMRSLLWLPIGLALLLIYPPDLSLSADALKVTREATYVTGMAELLPIGVKGIMITAMLAALGSTLDTHINWGSSYWTNDVYKRLICQTILKREPNPKTLVWVARFSNLAILALSLFVMTQLSSIQDAWQASLMLGSGLGGVLLLRWMWWRFNAWGEIACIGSTILLVPFFLTLFSEGGITPDEEALRLLMLAGITTLVGIVASLVMGPESRERLVDFYRRARPPGFWGPIAEAAGEPAEHGIQRLTHGFAAVFLAAASIFCVLVGIGTWMLDSPAPTWFPWAKGFWIGGLLVAGLALIPVWWRFGFGLHLEEMTQETAVNREADPEDQAAVS